jgi:predicted MFS family arabinose efflux permease
MTGMPAERRGAAFGSILAAFDIGIGTGSTALGWIIGRYGFGAAFAAAAALAGLALPYFLFVDRRVSISPYSAGRALAGTGPRI